MNQLDNIFSNFVFRISIIYLCQWILHDGHTYSQILGLQGRAALLADLVPHTQHLDISYAIIVESLPLLATSGGTGTKYLICPSLAPKTTKLRALSVSFW